MEPAMQISLDAARYWDALLLIAGALLGAFVSRYYALKSSAELHRETARLRRNTTVLGYYLANEVAPEKPGLTITLKEDGDLDIDIAQWIRDEYFPEPETAEEAFDMWVDREVDRAVEEDQMRRAAAKKD